MSEGTITRTRDAWSQDDRRRKLPRTRSHPRPGPLRRPLLDRLAASPLEVCGRTMFLSVGGVTFATMPTEMRNPAGRPYVVANVAVAQDGATTGFEPDVGRF